MNVELWGGLSEASGGGVEDEEREEEEEEEEEEEGMRCCGGRGGGGGGGYEVRRRCCGKLHADTTDRAGRQVATRGDRRQAAGRQEATPPLSRPPGRRPWEDGRMGDALPRLPTPRRRD